MKVKKTICFALFLMAFLPFMPHLGLAADAPAAFRSTEYPIPRFVSLGSPEVHVRSGPGLRYPIKWVFHKKTLPVEVVLEYDTWRKIRDHEGQEGWVHSSLLSGRRTGIIVAGEMASLMQKPKDNSRLRAKLEPGTVGAIHACEGAWCEMEFSGYKGWVERKSIWGVYQNENFD